MKKVVIEVENDLIKFFRDNIDDKMPVEELLSKMLKLLREILKEANKIK